MFEVKAVTMEFPEKGKVRKLRFRTYAPRRSYFAEATRISSVAVSFCARNSASARLSGI